jgi:iron complex outermembrane receptor protein
MGNNKLKIAFHADNILNCSYYDHTSYYRLIDVPEPGRNFSLMVGVEF